MRAHPNDLDHAVVRSLGILVLAGAACAAAAAAPASSAGAASGAQAREVRSWLLRIHEAASHRNFQGTFVVSSGGAVSSARIAHFCEGPSQFERSESLDGPARNVYRHDGVVTTVWPAKRIARIEQRGLPAQFPALLQAGDDRIDDFYEVRDEGSQRMAGHDANVLAVLPRDRYRYGYRLWADRDSDLLLRADVLGENQEVLETSAFSDVEIGVQSQPETVLQPMRRLEGYAVHTPALAPTRLESEGWGLARPVPGFREMNCVRRPMDSGRAASEPGAPRSAIQAIYSDGLSYVSVFIEPFDPQRHQRPLLAALGPTRTLMSRHDDWWVTVVGDVPTVTLRAFADALERSKK